MAIDLVDDAGPIGSEISVGRIGQDVGQDDYFRMLQVNLFRDEIIEIMPDADIGRLIRLDQIERERLKQQAPIDDVTRAHVISMRQVRIRPD